MDGTTHTLSREETLIRAYVDALRSDPAWESMCLLCAPFDHVRKPKSAEGWHRHLTSGDHRLYEAYTAKIERGLVIMRGGAWVTRARRAQIPYENIPPSVKGDWVHWILPRDATELDETLFHAARMRVKTRTCLDAAATEMLTTCARNVPRAWGAFLGKHDRDATWTTPWYQERWVSAERRGEGLLFRHLRAIVSSTRAEEVPW